MQAWVLRPLRWVVGLYYRETSLGGEVPARGPVLLVANHPNGLVDPVVLAGTTGRPLSFLGKAPLFDMPVIGSILRGIEALPVYRAKDGADTKRNTETFQAVFDALSRGAAVCLFPEGFSHNEPLVQELRTGAARMALGAEERAGFELGVRIVPVGLVYRAKRRFRSRVATWIGTPIEAGDLREEYARDDRGAVRILTERIAEGLRSVNVELDRWEDLPLLELAARLSRARGEELLARQKALADGARALRRRDPERLAALTDRVAAFGQRLARLGVDPDDIDVRYTPRSVSLFVLRSLLLLAFGFPLAIAGVVLWAVPYFLVPPVVVRLGPSRDIHATVQILTGLLLFPLWWLVLGALGLAAGGWPLAVGTLTAAPPLGLVTLAFLDWRREALEDASTFLRVGFRHGLRTRLIRERDAIAAEIEAVRRTL